MTLTLPDIPIELDAALRRRAAEQHRTVSQVAVDAMKVGLGLPDHPPSTNAKGNLASSIRARFAPLGGAELAVPAREPMPDPLDLGE